MNKDIIIGSFLALRRYFFAQDGKSIPFSLRPKQITQDDPFDELVAKVLSESLEEINCFKAPGASLKGYSYSIIFSLAYFNLSNQAQKIYRRCFLQIWTIFQSEMAMN